MIKIDSNLFIRIISSFLLFLFFAFFFFFYIDSIKYLVTFLYLLILIEIILYFKKNYKLFFLITYVLFSFILIQLYFLNYFQKEIFFLLIIIITFFDTISYLFGSMFGKKRILPKISPNKTYLGFIFGFFITIFSSLIYNFYIPVMETLNLIIFVIIIILSGFVGDIVESIFKRLSGIKNSSNLIPGHGGFFDRFDSYIGSAYLIFLFSYLF